MQYIEDTFTYMDKTTLRKTYLDKRLSLSDEEYDKLNKQLIINVFEAVDFSTIQYVHVFLPIAKFKEVNTWPIIEHIQLNYPAVNIVIPKVIGNELQHYLFENKGQLITSKWGIEEPENGTIINPELLDIVLVPLVIADKQGNRIGYGKGFYDRFLKQCKPACQTIGLSLLPLLDALGIEEPTDFPLQSVIVA